MRAWVAVIAACYVLVSVSGCEPDQSQNGCQIVGNTCKCGYGCKSEYIYKTRRACRNALKSLERTPSAGYNSGSQTGYERPNPSSTYESPNPNPGYGYDRTNPSASYRPGYDRPSQSAGYPSGYERNGAYSRNVPSGRSSNPSGYNNNQNVGYGTGYERTNPSAGHAYTAFGVTQALPMSPAPVRGSNICSSMPCSVGICIQTTNEPGFTCKCEGTGFYGQRCEKGCPTVPMRGMVFPHECVVI